MQMQIPEAFRYLATCFYSRGAQHLTAEEWVRSTVRSSLSREQRKVVTEFLDGVLNSSATDDDLQHIWERLDSDYWFDSGSSVRAFFRMIRDASGS
jgi:hypothetical protein